MKSDISHLTLKQILCDRSKLYIRIRVERLALNAHFLCSFKGYPAFFEVWLLAHRIRQL